ncbi:hypothetical protein DL766_002739 [Monosporascus sp. MC13-8B]|uniref:Zn(2)-C6 fungal-type domain-containing protein n=1 Tax=Monosporascus cannonballus TaxID=155416 RepID=A0ABY0HCY1_9PEZI|nr:hypothetical protein DL762_002812 [Monosporascus cannonballus]RYO97583.1 hypothetical protein DL763_002696 [Monosporascus cannonballus]RYP34931.1 hypothetical protein DL766_002739 [Monosporascus sp. MC13-8B]
MFPAAGSPTTVVDGENQPQPRRDDEPHRPRRARQLDRPRIRRRRGACESCKVKKTKCDGKYPCSGCQLYERPCHYVETSNPSNRKGAFDNTNQSGNPNHTNSRMSGQPPPAGQNPPAQRDLPTSKIDPRLSPHVNCRFPTSVHRDESFEGDNQTRHDNENTEFLDDGLDDSLTLMRTSENPSIPEMNFMEVDNMWESGPWVDLLSDPSTVSPTVEFHESGAQHGERMLAMPISGYEIVESMNESNGIPPDKNIGDLKRKRISMAINSNLHNAGDTHPVSREASRHENLRPSAPVLLMTPNSPNTYMSPGSNNRMGPPNHGLPMHGADEKMDVGAPDCALRGYIPYILPLRTTAQTRKRYIDACYEGRYSFGIVYLISRSQIDEWIEESNYNNICSDPMGDPCTAMVLNSLLALGSFTDKNSTANAVEFGANYWDHTMDGKKLDPSSKRHIGTEVFDRATTAQRHLRTTPEYFSVRTFRALIVMIIFAQELGHPILESLLIDAALVSHILKLHSLAGVKAHTQGLGEHEQIQLQRAFWLFYCIEKPQCLYSGRPSMLDDDFIDYSPPENACSAPYGGGDASHISRDDPDWVAKCEWLQIQCQYAKICNRISKSLFGQRGLQEPINTTMRTVNQLLDLLNGWAEINITSPRTYGMREDGIHREHAIPARRMAYIYQICTAKFIIHGRCLQIRDELRSQAGMDIYNRCQDECLNTARNLIQTISDMSFEKLLVNMYLNLRPNLIKHRS